MSKASQDLWVDWEEEKVKREQETFDLYIYNNFDAYGCTEVMQNMLLAFDKEVKKPKKNTDVRALWKNVEAMAWFLSGDLYSWRMSNDSDGNAVLVNMFGIALLTSIDILIARKLFTTNSEIRNIGLVLAKFLKFATDVGDDELCRSGENKWKNEVIRLTDDHSIWLYGVSGIRDIEDEIRGTNDADDSDASKSSDESDGPLVLRPGFYGVITADAFYRPPKPSWKSPDWRKALAAYSRNHGLGDRDVRLVTHKGSFARSTGLSRPVIGGDRFDITKMPEALKKKFELGAELSDQE